ncbi:MAG: M28 family peptidase [Planctomycetes bacterium]|nr:M28 family peptidase [Planctomycetota bacterium]MCB9887120.1 M28 family peptidase [Planctomycetota bacterium]
MRPSNTAGPWLPLLLGCTLWAQDAPKTGAAPTLPELGPASALPEGAPPLLDRIDRGDLRTHAYWLADDARAGRYTSSTGQQATADYIAAHFARLGLSPLGDKKGFVQNYPLERVYLDKSTALTIGGKKLNTDFAVLHSSDKDKVNLSGRFVWCGNGAPDQVQGGLSRKIPLVVFSKPRARDGDEGAGRQGPGNDLQAVGRYVKVAQQLANKGADAGVVCLLDDQGSFGNTLNYRGLLPDHAQLRYGSGGRDLGMRIPLLILSAAQSRLLLEHVGVELDEDGAPKTAITNEKATGKLTIVVKADDKAKACNVVAYLPGTNKKSEAVVFSAHHDHVGRRLDGDVFNGADDNASGTSGLLEIAEAFAKSDERPARSVIFLSVSGEELGLWGSHWFSENPTWPLEKIVADINIDMIGRAVTDADKVGSGKIGMQITPSQDHEKFSTLVQNGVAIGAKFGITFSSGDQYYQRSDHYNFARLGVPVVFFCDGEHPDYHKVTDSPDKLDYVSMEAIARTACWTGWDAANDKDRPRELGKQ